MRPVPPARANCSEGILAVPAKSRRLYDGANQVDAKRGESASEQASPNVSLPRGKSPIPGRLADVRRVTFRDPSVTPWARSEAVVSKEGERCI